MMTMGILKKDMTISTSKPLNEIATTFGTYLQNNGWKVQNNIQSDSAILQAQKGGILRDIIASDRALTFVLKDTQNGEINVHVGVANVLKNIGIMAIETILLSELFIFVDIPEMLFTEHIEKTILEQLKVLSA